MEYPFVDIPPRSTLCCILLWLTNDNTMIKTSDTVLRKIYLSLYLKGLCVRGSWWPNRTATYWPPHSYGHQTFLSRSLGCSSTRGPGDSSLLGAVFSTVSFLQFFWSPNWLPVFTELYNNSMPPFLLVGVTSFTHLTRPWSRLHSAIPQPDTPVSYIGAFPILTARPGLRSIYHIWPEVVAPERALFISYIELFEI